MFCNRCGAQLQPDFNVCPKCGKQVGDPVSAVAQTRLQRHLRTLGILWIVAGGLFLIPSFLLMAVRSVVPFAVPGAEHMARAFGPLVLMVIGSTLLIIAVGGILVGWGLMQHQPWARIAALVLGVLALFHPPFGTGLGIYTLWVLLADERGAEYDRLARAV
jgi:hypothetical protein